MQQIHANNLVYQSYTPQEYSYQEPSFCYDPCQTYIGEIQAYSPVLEPYIPDTLTYLQIQLEIPEYCVLVANYYYTLAYPHCPMEFDLMLTCLIIAFKFHQDQTVKNCCVENLIGYNTQALNSLEAHVLQILDYRLLIPESLLLDNRLSRSL